MSDFRSHLEVEGPKFTGKPHVWVQWKGTNVCADIQGSCGESSHYDGDFMYLIRCPHCRKVWEVGTHVTLYEPVREYKADDVDTAAP